MGTVIFIAAVIAVIVWLVSESNEKRFARADAILEDAKIRIDPTEKQSTNIFFRTK